MAHFVGGRVLFNECFNASYFFLPILSTLHTQNAIGGVDGRSGWKNMKRKRKCEKKGRTAGRTPWPSGPSADRWWVKRGARQSSRRIHDKQYLRKKTEMHTWYSSGQMTLIQPDELLPFQNLQNNNSGHLCAKLSRLIPAFQNVQNTHFSWLNIFARLLCPF